MKSAKIILFLSLFTFTLFGQKATKTVVNPYAAIDKKALSLPDSLTKTTQEIADYINTNFTTDKDKVRAIFIWVASNIQYDIENMFAINFYEKKDVKISKALQTRKGICENYAAVFNDICTKSNIKSFVIEGYTKQNGFTDYIPHAWCAALIDSAWYMFDPAWGSGYVNGGKFFKNINNNYFKAAPSTMIKSHMPFDYLWQFLNYPVSNQEFYEGKVQQNTTKPYFSYIDSVHVFEQQNHIEQLNASAYRIQKNGLKNSMLFDRLQHIRIEVENDRQNKIVNLYNAAGADYNMGINYYNDYINYRNKQFTPKQEDAEIQKMIDAADNKMKKAKASLDQIKDADANTTVMIGSLYKSIADATTHVSEQQEWLKTYLSKNKSGRKSMLYDRKITWFGIPLN